MSFKSKQHSSTDEKSNIDLFTALGQHQIRVEIAEL